MPRGRRISARPGGDRLGDRRREVEQLVQRARHCPAARRRSRGRRRVGRIDVVGDLFDGAVIGGAIHAECALGDVGVGAHDEFEPVRMAPVAAAMSLMPANIGASASIGRPPVPNRRHGGRPDRAMPACTRRAGSATWTLHRLRQDRCRGDVIPLAAELGDAVRPHGLEHVDDLVEMPATVASIGAHRLVLVDGPTEPHAHGEPSVARLVDRGQHPRQRHRGSTRERRGRSCRSAHGAVALAARVSAMNGSNTTRSLGREHAVGRGRIRGAGIDRCEQAIGHPQGAVAVAFGAHGHLGHGCRMRKHAALGEAETDPRGVMA